MKTSCDVIQDLLPLYRDDVCSAESSAAVEEHLLECEKCKAALDKLNDITLDDSLKAERDDVVGQYKKQVKRKSLTVGICVAAILTVPILVCLIVNLATNHALDWFFIVLTSLMVLASITVVPLVAETKKLLWSFCSFTVSLLLLLFTCAVFKGGSWFFSAAIPVFLGLSILFLPYGLYQIPVIRQCYGNFTRLSLKAGIVAGIVIAEIMLACLAINFSVNHKISWAILVIASLLVVASLIIVPLIAPKRKLLWTIASFTVTTMLLLFFCALYTGGQWFFIASVATLLGLSVFLLPVVMYQLPLKGFAARNKGLITMAVDTALLYSLIVVCGAGLNGGGYWQPALMITTVNVLFAWVIFAVLRYIKLDWLTKSGICLIITGLFTSNINNIVNCILGKGFTPGFSGADLTYWDNYSSVNANVSLMILVSFCTAGVILLVAGITRKIIKFTKQ